MHCAHPTSQQVMRDDLRGNCIGGVESCDSRRKLLSLQGEVLMTWHEKILCNSWRSQKLKGGVTWRKSGCGITIFQVAMAK